MFKKSGALPCETMAALLLKIPTETKSASPALSPALTPSTETKATTITLPGNTSGTASAAGPAASNSGYDSDRSNDNDDELSEVSEEEWLATRPLDEPQVHRVMTVKVRISYYQSLQISAITTLLNCKVNE